MPFQTKLLALVSVLTCAAIANAVLALWAATGFNRELTSMAIAEEQLALHIKLEADANDLFRRYAASLLLPSGNPRPTEALQSVVRDDIATIRRLVARELPYRGEEELEELERLDGIARGLESIEREYLRLRDEAAAGEADGRFELLLRFMTERIETQVKPLINEAVTDEREEVEEVREAAEALAWSVRWLAGGSVVLSILAAAFGSMLLLRSVLKPFNRLIAGIERLAAGELHHRIEVDIGGELARLSHGFNTMAERIEASDRALRAEEMNLQRMVGERTEALESANARLAETDATRRRFLADVSHELRTPLTVMRGEVEVALRARDESIPDGLRAVMGRVIEQAEHMGRLIDDLLFVARREAGEAKLALRPVPLAGVLEHAVADARVIAQNGGIVVNEDNDAPGVVLQADASRLRQLLMVLLDNALRYSSPGSAICVRAMRAPGGVAISVSDEGIGIPATDLPQVFERFARGSNALSDGTGLGLPVAKAIAEAHGGSLSIESEEGIGTTVTLVLPAANERAAPALRTSS